MISSEEDMLESNILERQGKYILGTLSNNFIPRKIQKCSPSWIPEVRRWAHVAALFWDEAYQTFCVIESHFQTGVNKSTFANWLRVNNESTVIHIFAHPYLKVSSLHSYIGFPYGAKDIKYLAFEKILNRKITRKDSSGIYCSELMLKCDNNFLSKACNDLKPNESRPTDIQEWALENTKITDLTIICPKLGVTDSEN